MTQETPTVYKIETTDPIAHLRMVKAFDAYIALWDLQEYLRSRIKFHEAGEETENIRSFLNDTLYNRGINLDTEIE